MATSAASPVSLLALFGRFLRLGALAFGGPVAQIATLRSELVDRDGWVTPERFRRALAVYQALPGPEATELCVWFGMVARGRVGAVLAGLGFVLPGLVLMLLGSALYWHGWLGSPAGSPVFAGLQAAVVGVVARAALRLAKHTVHDRATAGLAAGAAVAAWCGAPFWLVLPAAGLGYPLLRNGRPWSAGLVFAIALVTAWIVPPAAVAPAGAVVPPTLVELFGAGLRAGLLTFGGAYTVLPFLQRDAVGGGWLQESQFLDGVALGGVLPAPLVIVAAFVGYGAAGWAGALALTAGVFLPAFAFTLLGHGFFERLVERPGLHQALDGVTAGVVGMLAATAVGMAGAHCAAPVSAVVAALAFATLCRWQGRLAVPVVVLLGGAIGWLVAGAAAGA